MFALFLEFDSRTRPQDLWPFLISETRGPFLESPGNFTGPKSNIQIEI